MHNKSIQAPQSVVMIRPHHFTPNTQTAKDNTFQGQVAGHTAEQIASRAYSEVTQAVSALSDAGIKVHLFEDKSTATPDSVFPNNWFSTHSGGHIAVYPMYSPNRRSERRHDVLELLKQRFRVQDIRDYSGLEQDSLFLEGTGAMVIDHLERVAYAARSRRTSEVLLERFCAHFDYEPMVFDAFDLSGAPIYHTNVLMCIGTGFAMIGLDCIPDRVRRQEVLDRIHAGHRDVIELSQQQIADFAGNAIELSGSDGPLLALSQRALASLNSRQKALLEAHVSLLPLEIPTIELAGGSVRCMIAGIHLSERPQAI